jgi:hypothetical protein
LQDLIKLEFYGKLPALVHFIYPLLAYCHYRFDSLPFGMVAVIAF